MRKMIILAGFAFLASCNRQQSSTSTEQTAPSAVTAMAKMGQLATDPFTQMSFSFEGNPAPADIRERLDKVLNLYGLEPTNNNRSLAGRTLVQLRKEHGHSEMEILDKMNSTPADGAKFEEAAARIAAQMNQ